MLGQTLVNSANISGEDFSWLFSAGDLFSYCVLVYQLFSQSTVCPTMDQSLLYSQCSHHFTTSVLCRLTDEEIITMAVYMMLLLFFIVL